MSFSKILSSNDLWKHILSFQDGISIDEINQMIPQINFEQCINIISEKYFKEYNNFNDNMFDDFFNFSIDTLKLLLKYKISFINKNTFLKAYLMCKISYIKILI